MIINNLSILEPSTCLFSSITVFDYPLTSCSIFDSINNLLEGIKNFFDSIKTITDFLIQTVYYITHPKVFAWDFWNWTVRYSFWICLFISLFGVVAYLIGWKKGKKWAKGSILAYIIILMFNTALS